MKKKQKDIEYLQFHINKTKENKNDIYVFIPSKFWNISGIAEGIKNAIDKVFEDKGKMEKKVLN